MPAEFGVGENGVGSVFCYVCAEKVPSRAWPYESCEGTRIYRKVRALLRQVIALTGLSPYRARAAIREEIGVRLGEADVDQLRQAEKFTQGWLDHLGFVPDSGQSQ